MSQSDGGMLLKSSSTRKKVERLLQELGFPADPKKAESLEFELFFYLNSTHEEFLVGTIDKVSFGWHKNGSAPRGFIRVIPREKLFLNDHEIEFIDVDVSVTEDVINSSTHVKNFSNQVLSYFPTYFTFPGKKK